MDDSLGNNHRRRMFDDFWRSFNFIFVNAMETAPEAALMNLQWPKQIMLWENLKEVFEARNYMLVRAFWNSTLLNVLLYFVTGCGQFDGCFCFCKEGAAELPLGVCSS